MPWIPLSGPLISHVVWLYFRFSLSFRDINELMASRGIFVTYETIRQWTLKFGQTYANVFRCRRNRLSAPQYQSVRNAAFSLWNEVTNVENTQ